MLSTPPATTTSASPERIRRAASFTASRPLPHRRFTVIPGVSFGSPASRAAMRPTLRLSSPAWFDAPNTTSSTSSPFMPERSSAARMTCAARSSGRINASAPPYRPNGVRAYATTIASRGSLVTAPSRPVRSPALEPRGPLRQERAHALRVVGGASGAVLQRGLELEEGAEVALPRSGEALLREGERLRRACGELGCERAPLRRELGLGPHACDETDRERFVRADGATGEREVERAAPADQAREEERGARVGHEADLAPRRAEARGGRGHPQVAGDREPEAGARDDAVHRGDDRLAHRTDRFDRRVIAAPQLVAEPQVVTALDRGSPVAQILPGGERPARSGDDDCAHGGVIGGIAEPGSERAGQRLVERVQDVGAVEREDPHTAVALDPERAGVRGRGAQAPAFITSP